jgi:predicted O-methyltransferase YrrM
MRQDVAGSQICMESLPQVLREIFETRLVFAPDGTARPLESNVSPAEALELYAAVRNLCPEFSVEIGLAHGISALAILAAISTNGKGHHYVIDPFQANYGYCGESMIERSGYGDFHSFLEGFPEEVLPTLPGIKFAFIDSSHLFDLSLLEFVLIDKKLEVGGVVAFHDTWMPSIQAVLRFILGNRSYEICRDFSSEEPRLSSLRHFKQVVGAWLAKVPGADRFFVSNVFRPWASLQLGNLAFLKKLSDDRRDWQFHQSF